jgi:hypothetical protein
MPGFRGEPVVQILQRDGGTDHEKESGFYSAASSKIIY